MKYGVVERNIDPQGRVLLPKEWRLGVRTKKVLLIETPEYVKILPKKKG